MQNVSAAYKESMKGTLRDRGYLRVMLGIVDIAAQTDATITGTQYSYSDPSQVFKDGTDGRVYATWEDHFIKVGDWYTYFPPLNNGQELLEKAYISRDYGSTGNVSALISFGNHVITIDTMIINFGDHYPVDFDIVDSNGDTYEIRNNTERILEIEHTFEDVSSLTINVINMLYADNRLRIYSISFGRGLLYENDIIKDSSLEYSMSPINENLPQINFTLDLINENHRFDIDNPKSDLGLLDTSTTMNIYYGYLVEDAIEWIHGGKLYCNTWSTDRDVATIQARDVLQNNDTIYIYGSMTSITLYNLAVQVLTAMGIEDYIIDNDLSDITVTNPMPRVSCREALQIIANAAGKKLTLTRTGGVRIGDLFSYTLSSNGDKYGKLETIRNNETKYVYTSFEPDLNKVGDWYTYFLPTSNYKDVGFVSTNKSLNSCYFNGAQANLAVPEDPLNSNLAILEHTLSNEEYSGNPNPTITITIADFATLGGISITFGAQICEEFSVETYLDDTLLETLTVEENANKTVTVDFTQNAMNKIVITFIKTAKPETYVYVNYIEVLHSISSYKMTQDDMLTTPLFSKFAKIKDIVVPYFAYKLDTTEQTLAEESYTVTSTDDVYTVYMSEPCASYRLSVSSGSVTVTESNCFYVKFKFSTTGTKTLTIYGKKYNRIERTYTKILNNDGDTIRWENPLISTGDQAEDLANYLAEYYSCGGTYEYDTRGNPELDVNDVIAQEHWSGIDLSVRVMSMELNFNGGFSGKLTTLRLGEEE